MRLFKSIRLILLLCLSVSVLSTTMVPPETMPGNEKKYLPKELKKLKFGMNFAQVSRIKKGLTDVSDADYTFRKVYQEQINNKGIESIIYYFDSDGSLPLYEIIVIYESENLRDEAAGKLLGTPNYKNTEWQLDIKETYPLHAWVYKNKLIFAAPMKGTEWEDGI